MRAAILPFLIASLAGPVFHAVAQQDTTLLDVGYIKLNPTFTQTVTIKGTELERMPFTNLSDALTACLFGAHTQAAALQYIVDGNPVTDVNAYSIHDIDEVVWIENAAALGATAGTQQQLLVIKTRRYKSLAGITASAQTGLINSTANGAAHDNRLYHDYFATAWRNWTKGSASISANWIRDAYPMYIPNEKETTTFNLQRWRLNGFLNWQPNPANNFDGSIHFTSNELDYQFDSLQEAYPELIINGGALHQQLVNIGFRWQGNWFPGLHNELLGTYLLYRATALNAENGVVQITPTSEAQYEVVDQALRTSHHLWIRDRLSYQLGTGDWRCEPSLNISYEHIDMLTGNEEDVVGASPVRGISGVTAVGIIGNGEWQDADPFDIFFLTPSLDLGYKNWLDFRTGLQYSPSRWEYATKYHIFPFVSLSLDLLRISNPDNDNRLQLFASYAQRSVQSITNYTLLDVNNSLNVEPAFPYYYGAVYTGKPANYLPVTDATYTYPVENAPGYPSPLFWAWSTGLSYTAKNKRFQAQYYFERRNFTTSGILVTPANDSSAVFPQWQSTLQHAEIRATILETTAFSWTSSINLTLLRSRVDTQASLHFIIGTPVAGDQAPNPYSWTGGWVNRIRIAGFTAGIDLLYHFSGQTTSSIMLPNIFAGYRWRLTNNKAFEFFLETRALLRTSPSDLLDQRRYYTIGGKFTL